MKQRLSKDLVLGIRNPLQWSLRPMPVTPKQYRLLTQFLVASQGWGGLLLLKKTQQGTHIQQLSQVILYGSDLVRTLV